MRRTGIVVWHTDRLFRQPRDLETLIDLADKGFLVVSAHGSRVLTDPDDRFILRIEVAHAARSSDDTSLPSGIGDRTLLAYEHGLRQLTLCRLTELTVGLEVDPATVVARGLQRARLHLDRLTLHVDLRALLDHNGAGRGKFRPINQWARNALNENPHGVTEIDAKVVQPRVVHGLLTPRAGRIPRPVHPAAR